ncbi:MAG: carbohydrate ABC transporter permease [Spirochaetia bacterium]|jgi:raffinose/stachyose/melibiose transport system permease protein
MRSAARLVPFGKAAAYLLLGAAAVLILYPLFWLIPNSLKTTAELFNNPWSFSAHTRWGNFISAWSTGRVGRYFVNSLLVCSVSLLLIMTVSVMAAFAIKRLKWRGSQLVLTVFLLGAMIPVHAVLIPLFIQFTRLGLVGSYTSLILIYVSYALPVAIFILAGFFGSFPAELEQAAVLDGCSISRMFLSVTLPLTLPALMAVCMFNFVTVWNELLVAIVFISDAKRMTIPVGLSNFKSEYATDFSEMFAAVIITLLPSVVVYSVFNNRIIEGITSGAIKE